MGQAESSQHREATPSSPTSSPPSPLPTSLSSSMFTPIDKSQWQDKKTALFCPTCMGSYAKTRSKKHHCMKCGHVFCDTCSETYQHGSDARACKGCIKIVKDKLNAAASANRESNATNSGNRDNKDNNRDNMSRDNSKNSFNSSRDNIGGSRDNLGGSRDNIGSSRDNVGGRDNLGGSRDNLGGSRDNLGGSRDNNSVRRDNVSSPNMSRDNSNRDNISSNNNRDNTNNNNNKRDNISSPTNSNRDNVSSPSNNNRDNVSSPTNSNRDKVSSPTNSNRDNVSSPTNNNRDNFNRGGSSRDNNYNNRDGGSRDEVQAQLTEVERTIKELSDNIRKAKDLHHIVGDCKLKFQQIKKKEDTIKEYSKEQDVAHDVIRTIMDEKDKCVEIIKQKKKRIEEIDTASVIRRRLLNNVSDCDAALTVLESYQKSCSDKLEAQNRELPTLQSRVKTAAYVASDFSAQFSGEWVHNIPHSKFTPCDEYLRLRIEYNNNNNNNNDNNIAELLTRYLHKFDTTLISHIDVIHNPSQQRLFYGAIETFEKRLISGLFNAELRAETNADEREKALKRLHAAPYVAQHNREGVMIVGGFHGTTAQKAESIMKIGFANLATLDEGWYGKGIYFTPQPQYAYQYCKNKKDPCLIFCYLVMANPFPVIWNDATSVSELRFKGKSNYRNYGCHYVPVVHYKGTDYRPPNPAIPEHSTAEVYDEIVLFQETHILPFGIVHLRDVL